MIQDFSSYASGNMTCGTEFHISQNSNNNPVAGIYYPASTYFNEFMKLHIQLLQACIPDSFLVAVFNPGNTVALKLL